MFKRISTNNQIGRERIFILSSDSGIIFADFKRNSLS